MCPVRTHPAYTTDTAHMTLARSLVTVRLLRAEKRQSNTTIGFDGVPGELSLSRGALTGRDSNRGVSSRIVVNSSNGSGDDDRRLGTNRACNTTLPN